MAKSVSILLAGVVFSLGVWGDLIEAPQTAGFQKECEGVLVDSVANSYERRDEIDEIACGSGLTSFVGCDKLFPVFGP